MKVLLICSKSSVVIDFRKKLIEKLQSMGHQVVAIAFDRQNEEEIVRRGVEFHCCADANRSLNPFKVMTLASRIAKKVEAIQPDLVFTFMLKPNIYGVLGAKKAGADNIYSMVEGTGDVFTYNTLKWKMIRKFVSFKLKKSFKHSKRVFFINNDDRKEFIDRKLVKEEQTEVIHGIGVDLEKFTFTPVKNKNRFLMIARLLKTKGVFEYCEAAEQVKKQYPDAVFDLVGPEGTIKKEDIKKYIDSGAIVYHGKTDDVRPFIDQCSVHVLPSYKEGLGLVNVEAGARGRASITCDTNGTRDTVKDGYNGFLVPVGNSEKLAEKMIWFLEHPEAIEEMGRNSREYVESKFDQKIINEKICRIIGV